MRLKEDQSKIERVLLGVVIGLALAIWIVSASLIPDPLGYSTHTQLGWGPCPRMAQTGWPCLTCGMTTAFAYAARGRIDRAFVCQPFGALLFLGLVALAIGSAICLSHRRSVFPTIIKLLPWRLLGIGYLLLILLIASWVYKAREPIRLWLNDPAGNHGHPVLTLKH
jgi:hypothetical protein